MNYKKRLLKILNLKNFTGTGTEKFKNGNGNGLEWEQEL